ncbi:MAG: ATP-binding cassette domain-containing protein [Saprospiraceae bacterium]|jgi:ABC-2 type transport system ATP-binding protein|nr:ATP-binding cassette domain-containing protein [Saprospiraceae bacterium]
MINIENLSKSYGGHQVLKGINLSLAAGQVHGIVGENGAGKTTLFKCIAGLEDYEGSIQSAFNPLKNHLGLLPTDPFFFSKITGREYLLLLCNARLLPPTDLDAKNIFDLPLNQYASTYSTGMKKKLALTAILLQNNEVFILDEPFNGVDIHSNMVITEIIQKLRSLGKTVLISSHIFSTLNDTCDRIYLLKEGLFVRQADRDGFGDLEAEMRAFTVGDRVARLGLG